MLGLGGGVFLVPLLNVALNLPLQVASGVSLMTVIATSSVVARGHRRTGLINLRLGVMLQAYCHVTPLFDVPPGAFRPPPKVDSAVVRLVPRKPDTIGVEDAGLFSAVVRDAFGQRRKTLRNALSNLCDAAAIEAAGVRPDARAEQIEVADFVRLANALQHR